MRRKIRCSFDLHSSEITGVPNQYQQVKVVVDHQAVSKRYAASYPAPTAATASNGGICTTMGLEDPSDHLPLLSWQCGVYPGKAVNLRLMATTAAPTRTFLLARGPQWSHLATATLHLDTLAQQLLLPGVAAAAVPPTATPPVLRSPTASARSSIERPTTPPASPATAAAATATGGVAGYSSPQHRPACSPVRPTSPFASIQPLSIDENDDADSELFTTDSLAAAATAGHGCPSTDSRATSALGCLSDLPSPADVAAVQDTAEVPPDADEAAGGSYQQDTQTTQLIVNWVPAAGSEGDLQLMQELVVTARLLGASSPLRLLSRMSPGSASSKRSAASSMLAGKGKGQALFWSKTMNNKDPAPVPGMPTAAEACCQHCSDDVMSACPCHPRGMLHVHRSATAPPVRGGTAAAAAVPQAPAFHSKSQPELAHLDASGRLPSLGHWCSDQQPQLTDAAAMAAAAAAAGPSVPRHRLATATGGTSSGSPLSPRSPVAPTATPFNTPAQLPPGTITTAAAANSTAARISQEGQASQQRQPDSQAEADTTVQRDFLELILATLSGAHSVESEGQLPPAPSAAQLVAAASLSRSPSAADLAAFAAAAGLPIHTVEAAATKLPRLGSSGTPKGNLRRSNSGSTQLSSSNSSSVRSSPQKVALVSPAVGGSGSAAAAIVAGGDGSGMNSDMGYGLYDVVEEVEGHDVAVPVAVAVTETALPGLSATAAEPASAAHRTAAAAQVVDSSTAAACAGPAAVVTATALAVSDADVAIEGWEPQQLAVVTTTFTAAPAAAEEPMQVEQQAATDGLSSSAGATDVPFQATAGGISPAATPVADVVVTTATDLVVTEPADVAADLTAAAAEGALLSTAETATERSANAEPAESAAGGMVYRLTATPGEVAAPQIATAADMAERQLCPNAAALQVTKVVDGAQSGEPASEPAARHVTAGATAQADSGTQMGEASRAPAEAAAVSNRGAMLPPATEAAAPSTAAGQLAAAVREAMLADTSTLVHVETAMPQAEQQLAAAEAAMTGRAEDITASGESDASIEPAAGVPTDVAVDAADVAAVSAAYDAGTATGIQPSSGSAAPAQPSSVMWLREDEAPAQAAAAAQPDVSSSPCTPTHPASDSSSSSEQLPANPSGAAAAAAAASAAGKSSFAWTGPAVCSSSEQPPATAPTDSTAMPFAQYGHAQAAGNVSLEASHSTEQLVAPVPAQLRPALGTRLAPTSPLPHTAWSSHASVSATAATAHSASLKQLELQLKQQIHQVQAGSSSNSGTTPTTGSTHSVADVHNASDSSSNAGSGMAKPVAATTPIVPSATSSGTVASLSSSLGGASAAADALVGSMGARRELIPGLVEGSSGSFTFAGAGLSSMPAALTTAAAAADHVSGSNNGLLLPPAPAALLPHEALGIVAATPGADFALHDEVDIDVLPAGTAVPAAAAAKVTVAEPKGSLEVDRLEDLRMVDSLTTWQENNQRSQPQQQQQQQWLDTVPLSRECELLPSPGEVAAAAAAQVGPAVQHFIVNHPAASAGVLPTAAAATSAAEITPADDVDQAANPSSTTAMDASKPWAVGRYGNDDRQQQQQQQQQVQPEQSPLLSSSSSRLAQVLQSMNSSPSEQCTVLPAAVDLERDWHLPRVSSFPHIRPASAASAAAAAITCVGGVLAAASLGAVRLVGSPPSSPTAAFASNRGNRSNTATAAELAAAAAPPTASRAGTAPSPFGHPLRAMVWAASTALSTALFVPRRVLAAAGSMLGMNSVAAAGALPSLETVNPAAEKAAVEQQQQVKEETQQPAAPPHMPKLPARPHSTPATEFTPEVKAAGLVLSASHPAAAAAVMAGPAAAGVMPSYSSSNSGGGVCSLLQLLYLLSWQLPWSVAAAVVGGWAWLMSSIVVAPASLLAAWMKPPSTEVRSRAWTVAQLQAAEEAWEQASQASSVGSSSSPNHVLVNPQDLGAADEVKDAVEGPRRVTASSNDTGDAISVSSALGGSSSGGWTSFRWLVGSREAVERPLPPTPAPSLESPGSVTERSWSSMLPPGILAALSPASYAGLSLGRRSSPGYNAPETPTTAAAPVTAASPTASPTAQHADDEKHLVSGSSGDAASAATAARRTEHCQGLPVVISGHELAAAVAETGAGSNAPMQSRLSRATGGAAKLYGSSAQGSRVQGQVDGSEFDHIRSQPTGWSWFTARGVAQPVANTDASVASPADTAAQQAAGHGGSSSRGWWPTWGTASTPAGGAAAPVARQVSGSWLLWPSTTWFAGQNAAMAAAQSATAYNALAGRAAVPGMVAPSAEDIAPATAAAEDAGGRTVETSAPALAAAAAPAGGDATAAASVVASPLVEAWQLASRVVDTALAPVVWYWHGVFYAVSSGVDMTSRLVELAVWWALLPARIGLWAVMLPFRMEVRLYRWLMPLRDEAGPDDAVPADYQQQAVQL